MNTRNLIQASVIAALFAAGAAAQAAPVGDGDTLQNHAVQVQSTRSFAQAQSASLASNREGSANFSEGYGEGVHVAGNGQVDRAAVRAAAIQAQRSGSIEQGDAVSF